MVDLVRVISHVQNQSHTVRLAKVFFATCTFALVRDRLSARNNNI